MSRYHYWQFLINQEGQPINNAEVSVYLAGTNTPVTVYVSEFGGDIVDEVPQTITNRAGYFEFWLGDDQESNGYPIGQKFKIRWNREGIASGSIDWVDIYPGFEPVNEENSDSTIKNKLISNALAYKWDSHASHTVVSHGYPIHGFTPVVLDESDNLFNKIINNEMGNRWEEHVKESINHRDLYIHTSGLLTGGGQLTDSVTINLEGAQVDHNNLNNIQGGSAAERFHLTNLQHSNLTSEFPSFTNVIISGSPSLPEHAVKKDYVDQVAQGIYWQNSIISFWDPEANGFPDFPDETDLVVDLNNGDRFISTKNYTDGPVTWQKDYIYEYYNLEWIEIEPTRGFTVLVEEENRHYHYDGDKWIKFWAGFAWYLIDTDTFINNRSGYLVDCSETSITLFFPSAPSLGYRIDVLDFTANSQINNIILDGNGKLIEGQLTLNVDVNGAGLQMVYTTDEYGWKVINEVYI